MVVARPDPLIPKIPGVRSKKRKKLPPLEFPVFSRRCAKKARKRLRIFGAMF
jgi:hypothetical protein